MTITRTFTDGPDSFTVSTNDVYQLNFAGGDDILRIVAGTTTADMGAGNDRARVDGGSATIFGQEGADLFNFYGGSAIVDGGADNDRFNILGGSNHLLRGGGGDDRFVFYAGATDEQLSGDDGNDLFYGNGFAVSGRIDGGAGNDAFYGFGNVGNLQVTLAGGAGNDIYSVMSSSGPIVVENAGEGTDTVQLARGISYTLGANLENLSVSGRLGTGQDATLTGNALANRITGSSGRDTIDGMAGNDVLNGGAGDDAISGGDGNDRIIGGSGADTLSGGAGRDTFVYTSAADSLPGPFVSDGGDWIMGWEAQDRIDLSAIDANTLIDGNQAFQFAGYSFGQPPSGHAAGTLYIGGFVNQLWIIGYTDGDATPDLLINLYAPQDEVSLNADNLVF